MKWISTSNSQHKLQEKDLVLENLTPNPRNLKEENWSFQKHMKSLKNLCLPILSVWKGSLFGWAEQTYPFDLSWQNLIWGRTSADVLKFVINSSVNWVRTPDLLHLWGYKKSCCCVLCGAEKCTLHHILSNCSFSLTDKRFTWRHDSVLSLIYFAFKEHIESLHNARLIAISGNS